MSRIHRLQVAGWLFPTVLFVWVAVLSAVRLDPIEAQCAGPNDLVAHDGARPHMADAITGAFSYTLTVDSWELTFDPNVLILDLEPAGGTINVTGVTFTPSSATVSSLG